MPSESKTSCIGILTSGGDCPGLNAAIRAVTKAAINEYNMTVTRNGLSAIEGISLINKKSVQKAVRQKR